LNCFNMVDKALDDIIADGAHRKAGKGGGKSRGGKGARLGGESPGNPWSKRPAAGDTSFWLHDDRVGDGPSLPDDEFIFAAKQGNKGRAERKGGKSGGKGRKGGKSAMWDDAIDDYSSFGRGRKSGEATYGKWKHDLFMDGMPYDMVGAFYGKGPYDAGWGKKGGWGGGKSKGKGKLAARPSALPEKCPW